MSIQDFKDFEEKLLELNNWQIEQQKKLRAFQEAQRMLLDLEHQSVLNTLNIQNGSRNYECQEEEEEISDKLTQKQDLKTNPVSKSFKNEVPKDFFKIKCEPIKLTEAKTINFGMNRDSYDSEDDKNEFDEDSKENSKIEPKRFLKRGEGLARFRMKMEDFKTPPKIYKEKRIKTYLNPKPENNYRNMRCKTKPSKPQSKVNTNLSCKNSKSVPVNIFTSKKCNGTKTSDFKDSNVIQNYNRRENFSQFPKVCSQSLSLKPCKNSTECVGASKKRQEFTSSNEFPLQSVNSHTKTHQDVDIERKKDEKELKIFEILEQKVVDTSFSSTSSFVDKLMDQSFTSPSKFCIENEEKYKKTYSQGLKFLQSQFLNEEQIKKFESLNNLDMDEEVDDVSSQKNDEEEILSLSNQEEVEIGSDKHEQKLEEEVEIIEQPPQSKETEKVEDSTNHKTNKMLLHEYIKNFKKLKCAISENERRMEDCKETSSSDTVEDKKEEQQHIVSQREINLKMQRKGLQDNIKQILNWECTTKRRPPKRVVKKNKIKPVRSEKVKIQDKEECEKVILDSTLLKERLDELEKEISIFKLENKKLDKLQKECNEERMKLARERKDFEKQILEEHERFEAKMAEEQKKLQRDKAVFEKYCKQIKSQPTKAEREEIINLKKEVETLKEQITTKESRWAASQARLRNRIKFLEKQNSELKSEVEKYNKLSVKKIKFGSGKNINTKIIHAINSELGKLKPTRANSTHTGHQLSERLERNCEKPIRRIKSVPNMKKTGEVEVHCEVSKEVDEKGLGSVSTDSGIETSGFRCEALPEVKNSDAANISLRPSCSRSNWNERFEDIQRDSSCESPVFGQSNKKSSKDSDIDLMESVVHEALFGNLQRKKNCSKDSELEKSLSKSHSCNGSKEKLDYNSTKIKTKSISSLENNKDRLNEFYIDLEEDEGGDDGCCNSYKENDDNDDEDEDDETKSSQDKECGMNCCCRPKMDSKDTDFFGKYSSAKNYVFETKLDDNGVREKIFDDGTKEIRYPNGNIKTIFPGNKIVKVIYYNGDVKETNVSEGSEKYYYAETKTWHTTYKDGLEVLEFPNGQTERRHPDGSMEISFPNGCVRYCDSRGRDEWRFLDGTVIKTDENGHKVLLMPNGQKEIYTKEFKKREYPDGTVKILYADGTQETRYASGRVRLKSKEGTLLMDSGGIR